MSTIIMDLCSYTRLGLTGYLLSRGAVSYTHLTLPTNS
ncbi:hypothetical protein ACX3VG_20305, partial [Escherichia coli]